MDCFYCYDSTGAVSVPIHSSVSGRVIKIDILPFSLRGKVNTIVIEKHENFVKQTYRNRCDIVTANGKLSLSIPLIKQADKELISDKKISYAEDWRKQHWRTIVSAYKNSPYFEFFEDEFKP